MGKAAFYAILPLFVACHTPRKHPVTLTHRLKRWAKTLLQPNTAKASPLGKHMDCTTPAWQHETRLRPPFSRPVAFCFHINPWKRPHVARFLPHTLPAFAPMRFTWQDALPLIESVPDKVLVVWGYHDPPGMAEYAQAHNLPLYRMEDGFLRSVGLGSHHAAPYSLILDDQALYFDARQPSRLELILNQLTLTPTDTLWQDAETLRQQLIALAISKYNYKGMDTTPSAHEVYGGKERKRVLVIGQVESDASIKYGCPNLRTNEGLLALALAENPDAQVIYKPHPDVTTGKQPSLSAPETYSDQALMLQGEWPLAKALETVDHLYTLTSLAGMEALLRQSIKVTVLGQPFYSGWGLTDDREPLARRQAKLSLQELIAGVYLLYPKYVDPDTSEVLTALQVVQRLHQAIQ